MRLYWLIVSLFDSVYNGMNLIIWYRILLNLVNEIVIDKNLRIFMIVVNYARVV